MLDEWGMTRGERFLASTPDGADWVPLAIFGFLFVWMLMIHYGGNRSE